MTPCFVQSVTFTSRSAALGALSRLSAHAPRTSAFPTTNAAPLRRATITATLPGAEPSALQTYLLLSDISEVNRGPLFATAFVFFLTFWGSIPFVRGSTKDRITQASFNISEPASDIAKKSARYLMERSFDPDPTKDDRKGVMTFTGKVRASSSVASILVAVAASGIWAATYILNFILPSSLQSNYWGLLTLGSIAIVPWYWKNASRTEYVKLMVEEENDYSTLYVKGHRDEIEELEKHFSWKRNEPVYEDEVNTESQKSETVGSQ